jgi:hypothetical protein
MDPKRQSCRNGRSDTFSCREPFPPLDDYPVNPPAGRTVVNTHSSQALTPQDELVIVRCQLGERAAFDALMQRWSEPLHRHACRLCDDPERARDLTQDIWLRVLRGIGGLRDNRRFRAWLFGLAHRAFVDTLRNRYREPPVLHLDVRAARKSALRRVTCA